MNEYEYFSTVENIILYIHGQFVDSDNDYPLFTK